MKVVQERTTVHQIIQSQIPIKPKGFVESLFLLGSLRDSKRSAENGRR